MNKSLRAPAEREIVLRAGNGDYRALKEGLKLGGSAQAVGDRGETAAHAAVRNRRWASALLLMHKGANIYARNRANESVLDVAWNDGNYLLGKALIWISSLREARSPVYKRTVKQAKAGIPADRLVDADGALRLAVLLHRNDEADALLKAGANPNTPGPGGQAALHMAGLSGNAEVVPNLEKHGANMCARDDIGWHPADYALHSNNTQLGSDLIESEKQALAESQIPQSGPSL